MTAPPSISTEELRVLGAVHRADEEEGGLGLEDLDEDEREALGRLALAGLVEMLGEEDGEPYARVTWRGVDVLRDHRMPER